MEMEKFNTTCKSEGGRRLKQSDREIYEPVTPHYRVPTTWTIINMSNEHSRVMLQHSSPSYCSHEQYSRASAHIRALGLLCRSTNILYSCKCPCSPWGQVSVSFVSFSYLQDLILTVRQGHVLFYQIHYHEKQTYTSIQICHCVKPPLWSQCFHTNLCIHCQTAVYQPAVI